MKIVFETPVFLCEKGKRENNEDYILQNLDNQLFIVCDGVGGSNKGEVASKVASEKFAEYYDFHKKEGFNNEKWLNAFEFVQQFFDHFIELNPENKGMATTVVLLNVDNQGITILHCGDSRCYHLRNNEIIWQTQDHTMLNDLVRFNVISKEEAMLSPKNNQLSRAIQGNKVRRTKPDIENRTDLQEQDYFLLCTDGIFSAISDKQLTEIICNENSLQEKIAQIQQLCTEHSKDNFSCFLLKIVKISKYISIWGNLFNNFK